MTILVAAMALGGLTTTAPGALASHGSVPWSAPYIISSAPTDDFPTNLLYNGNHTLYFVIDQTATSGASANLSFVAESDTGLYGYPQYLYASRPNDQVSGVGSVAPFEYVSGLTIDPSGRVYVAWVRAAAFTGGNGDDVYVSTSGDGGRTWPVLTRGNAANDMGGDEAPVLRAARDGRVWLAYTQNWGPFTNITFAFSADQGLTFQGFHNVTNARPTLYVLGYDFQVDPHGRLHLVYSQCTAAFICSLYYTRSDDGIAWSAPVALVTGGTVTVFAMFPALTIQGDSTLHLGWYDSRLTPADTTGFYYARSTDLGATWTTPVPISQGVVFPSYFQMHIAASGDTVMAVWGGNANGLSWAVSATDGDTWYPEQFMTSGGGYQPAALTVDSNGTFHAALAYATATPNRDTYGVFWNGPPDAPTALSAAPSGARGLRISWTPPAQGDVVAYHVYRSPDGSTYSLVASVPAPSTSYTDAGLANGTYWYKVTAYDSTAHESHDSVPVSGTVGPSVADEINGLEGGLNGLRSALGTANATLAAVQGQLNDVKAALGTTNLIVVLLVVVIVIQALMFLVLLRRPKGPAPAAAPVPSTVAGPPPPSHPEDEL